jgi:hypothetical protein
LWLIRKEPNREDVADAFEYGKAEGYNEALEMITKKIEEYSKKPPLDMCMDEELTGFGSALSVLQEYVEALDKGISDDSKGTVTLCRGHHIRNADGTVTDVSNDPRYKCKED